MRPGSQGERRAWAPLFVLALASLAWGCKARPGLELEATWKTGPGAASLRVSPDGRWLAIACPRSSEIWLHDTRDGKARTALSGLSPRDAVFAGEGKLWVAESGRDSVSILSLSDGRVVRRYRSVPGPALIERLGEERVAVAGLSATSLAVYRAKDFRMEKAVDLKGRPRAMSLSLDGQRVLVALDDSEDGTGGSLRSFRATDLDDEWASLVKGRPVAFAESGPRKLLWVAGAGSYFEVASQDPASPEGLSPSSEAEGEAEWDSTPGFLNVLRLPDGVAVDQSELCPDARALRLSSSGRYLYALCGEEGMLSVIDSGDGRLLAQQNLAGDPALLALAPDGRRLYVVQRDLRQISVFRTGDWR